MLTIAWYLGIVTRVAMVPRITIWAKRLPFFALALLVYLIQSAGTRFWLYDPFVETWAKCCGIVYAILRIGAYIEALRWLFQTIPGFRIGWLVFGVSSLAGIAIQWQMAPLGTYLEAYRIPAMLERSTGVGVAVALVVGLAFYDLLGGFCTSARWHSVTVALWGVLDAAGWAIITNGKPYHGSTLIIAGAIICPLLWLAKVTKAPPSWGQHPPPDAPELVDAAEAALKREAGL